MSMESTVLVHVNGESRAVPIGLSLLALLHHLGINEKRVAVEWNRLIVKPDRWPECAIQDGDEIEVVHFVGGGSTTTTDCG